MDFQPINPDGLNSSSKGELYIPLLNRSSRLQNLKLESLSGFDTVLQFLEKVLRIFSRESEDPGTRLPLSMRFPLEVYENEEEPWEIQATNKILHDQYTAIYWKLALQKLQMERGEQDEPTDPTPLSSGSKKKESEDDSRKDDDDEELERKSSESDPEPASRGTRRSEDCIRRPLVSENFMTIVARHIPYRLLNIHPPKWKFSSIEISMKGIITAFKEVCRQLTFYRKVARNMCLEILQPESQPQVPDYLKQNLLIFLEDFFSFQCIMKGIFYVGWESRELTCPVNNMTYFKCYLLGIEKQILNITKSRNYIILLNYESVKRMQEELENYHKAICDLKIV